MKKILLILLFVIPTFCYAQTNQPDSTKAKEVYCMVIATGKLFSNKVSIQVDFGQETSWWKGRHGDQIKDETGQVVNFNSVIDALNYMATKGWVFVNAYALSEGTSGRVLNYIMRRPLQ
jgi:hypothetical protein